MKTYYLKLVINNVTVDIASVQADNEDMARAIVDKAARGRGLDGHIFINATETDFITFKNEKLEREHQAKVDAGSAEFAGDIDPPAAPAAENPAPAADAAEPAKEAVETGATD